MFCTESIKVNTPERDGVFDRYFLPFLLKLGYNEKDYAVMNCLVKALPKIREGIIDSGNGNALLQLNQMVSEIKHMPNLHPEVFKNLYAHTLAQKSEEGARRVARMANIDLFTHKLKGEANMRRLEKR